MNGMYRLPASATVEQAEIASDDMLDGYIDGLQDNIDALPAGTNRSLAYQHGWMNGRDDRLGTPRASADTLRKLADHLLGGF